MQELFNILYTISLILIAPSLFCILISHYATREPSLPGEPAVKSTPPPEKDEEWINQTRDSVGLERILEQSNPETTQNQNPQPNNSPPSSKVRDILHSMKHPTTPANNPHPKPENNGKRGRGRPTKEAVEAREKADVENSTIIVDAAGFNIQFAEGKIKGNLEKDVTVMKDGIPVQLEKGQKINLIIGSRNETPVKPVSDDELLET